MTKENCDRVSAIFDASTRNLTPPSWRQSARVLYSPVSPDPEVTKLCVSVLSEAEIQKASDFVKSGDRALFVQRRAFRRFCGARAHGATMPLSQVSFDATQKGRPYFRELPDYRFSFSSCRFGFAGAWSSTLGIGIDLEDDTRVFDAEQIAALFFSKTETHAIQKMDGRGRQQAFFRLWTLKEAALKSIGEGLPFGLDAFEFELESGLDQNPGIIGVPCGFGGPEQFSAYLFKGIECSGAMVVRGQPC